MRIFFLVLGHLSVGLGFTGIFLPVLPTTPFLILAAWAYSHGSPRFESWLLTQPLLGPMVKDWRENRVIRRRPKIIATITILITISIPLSIPTIDYKVKTALVAMICSVLVFIWTRPEISLPKAT